MDSQEITVLYAGAHFKYIRHRGFRGVGRSDSASFLNIALLETRHKYFNKIYLQLARNFVRKCRNDVEQPAEDSKDENEAGFIQKESSRADVQPLKLFTKGDMFRN